MIVIPLQFYDSEHAPESRASIPIEERYFDCISESAFTPARPK